MARRDHRDHHRDHRDYEEESDNQDRWLVSYADLVTLLFALFVVMYAVSSVNEVKYRILTTSVLSAFGQVAPPNLDSPKKAIGIAMPSQTNLPLTEAKAPSPEPSSTPSHEEASALPPPTPEDQMLQLSKALSQNTQAEIGLGRGSGLGDSVQGTETLIPTPPPFNLESGSSEENNEKAAKLDAEEAERIKQQMEMDGVANDISSALAPLISGGSVSITRSTSAIGVRIEINASVLFSPAGYQLNMESTRALSAVAQILAKTPYIIQVDGYTDTTPIKSSIFPSNWELSAARAGAVVRLFTQNGIADERLTASGHGANDPVQPNSTAEGRAKNRRVTVGISSPHTDAPGAQGNSSLSPLPPPSAQINP